MIHVTIDPSAPDPAVIEQVAASLRGGGLAVIPTDTLYGLAANPFDPGAVARVFTVKRRDAGQALPLVAGDRLQVERLIGPLDARSARLADRYWPGPLTLLLPRPATIGDEVTGGGRRIGVRVPAHPVTRALCLACGTPLTATSANISGQAPSHDPEVTWRATPPGVDVLLDAGLTPGGPPSTIVDVTGPAPVLIRAGAIPWQEILACLDHPA